MSIFAFAKAKNLKQDMVGTIELFEALKTRFGEAEAKVIVKEIEKVEEGIEFKVEKAVERRKDILATKEDLANLKGELKADIANSKADMIKWMFIFWIGQVAVIAGLLAYFFHLNK